MTIVVVVNPKGGVGKSTLSTNIAGYFASTHRQVMLGDTDAQQSSRHWLTLRPDTLPKIRTWDLQADLVINATSLGMKRTDPRLIPASLLTPDLMIYDMIYRPAVTRLLEDAQNAGARTANGLSLLLHQGALALEIWLNRPAPLDAMRRALDQAAA